MCVRGQVQMRSRHEQHITHDAHLLLQSQERRRLPCHGADISVRWQIHGALRFALIVPSVHMCARNSCSFGDHTTTKLVVCCRSRATVMILELATPSAW